MPNLAPIKLTLYGVNDEIKGEFTRSIIPFGVLERAIDMQDMLRDVEQDEQGKPILSKDQYTTLADFVVFLFDDKVTHSDLSKYASLEDVFGIYQQIFTMVSEITPTGNPTKALSQKRMQGSRQ